jgi:hypothetical protein
MQQSSQPFAMIVKRSFVNAIPKIWFKAVFTLAKFLDKNARDSDSDCTCLTYLGQSSTNQMVSIGIAEPKVAKTSTANVAVAGTLVTNFCQCN